MDVGQTAFESACHAIETSHTGSDKLHLACRFLESCSRETSHCFHVQPASTLCPDSERLDLSARSMKYNDFRIFGGDHDILLKCFNSFSLPCLEYCSPVWSSAADSHLKHLDRNLRACKFLIPNFTISLQHHHFISSLCMLYKIFRNPSHLLHSELSNLFCPRRVTRGSLSINSLSFSPMRFHTSQYSRCFIPATTKLWNELPSMIVEATELQKFKLGANAFLLGVDGL